MRYMKYGTIVKWGKYVGLFLVFSGTAAAGSFPAFAAPIRRIRVRLEAEEFDGKERPLLEAVSCSEAYEVLEIRPIFYSSEEGPARAESGSSSEGPASEGSEITERDEGAEEEKAAEEKERERREIKEEPEKLRYEIELLSEEGRMFSVLEEGDIVFSGAACACRKAVRTDGGRRLILTAELLEPGEVIGEVEACQWDGSIGRWKKADNADTYLVMLYRDGQRAGYAHRTSSCFYDFTPLMQERGVYFFKIWPLTEQGKRGRETLSPRKRADGEEIRENQERWGSFCERLGLLEKETAPGWYQSDEEWYYIQKDGSIPQENWLELEGEWYYFDREGRMKTGGWQEWKKKWYLLGEKGQILEERGENPEKKDEI